MGSVTKTGDRQNIPVGEDRPFYRDFAWAFDLLVSGPVERRCAFMVDQLAQRGVHPDARLLDAGCGTGAYSIVLARHGFTVVGIDAASALIAEARKKTKMMSPSPAFVVGDLLRPSVEVPFDAVLCRGVLNDIIDGPSRLEAFHSFARLLRPGGVLVLDVREWSGTARRKAREPILERSIHTARGQLAFRSVTTLEPERRALRVAEQHRLVANAGEVVSEHAFVMRCWTIEELRDHLDSAGFGSVELLGDYDGDVAVGAKDRLVAVATLGP